MGDGETEVIPVITEEMVVEHKKSGIAGVEALLAEAQHRHDEQLKASAAILGVEKVKIHLVPLIRDGTFTDDELQAIMATRAVLEAAQRRLTGIRDVNAPMLELPAVSQQPAKDFDWDEEKEKEKPK